MAGPADYVARYHSILISDPGLGILETVDVRNYCSGWSTPRQQEYDTLTSKLAAKARQNSLPLVFSLRNNTGIDETEIFYRHSLRRAYLGKGSPNEIIDTLRLAFACGLIKPGRAGADNFSSYVRSFIGLDCNGFVGNYYGLSPEVKPRAWAQGMSVPAEESAKQKAGITKAIELTVAQFPLTARKAVHEIAIGDIVITVKNDAPVHSHAHIALIDSISRGGDSAGVGIAEWGQAGPIDVHLNSAEVELVHNAPATKMWKQYGLAWASGDAYRHIFAPPCPPYSAGWGRCHQPEI